MVAAAGPLATWTPVTPDRGVTKRIIRPPTPTSSPPGSRPSSAAIHYTIRATPTVEAPACSNPAPTSHSPSAAAATVACEEVLEDSRICRRRRRRPLMVTPGAAAVLPGLEALAGSLGCGEVALGFIAPAWAYGATAASRRRRPALAAATLLVTVERVEVSSPPLPRAGVAAGGWGAAPPPATSADARSDRGASRHGCPAATNIAVGADGGGAAKSSWAVGVALDGRLSGGCQDDADGAPCVSDVTSDDASERADPQTMKRTCRRPQECGSGPRASRHQVRLLPDERSGYPLRDTTISAPAGWTNYPGKRRFPGSREKSQAPFVVLLRQSPGPVACPSVSSALQKEATLASSNVWENVS